MSPSIINEPSHSSYLSSISLLSSQISKNYISHHLFIRIAFYPGSHIYLYFITYIRTHIHRQLQNNQTNYFPSCLNNQNNYFIKISLFLHYFSLFQSHIYKITSKITIKSSKIPLTLSNVLKCP